MLTPTALRPLVQAWNEHDPAGRAASVAAALESLGSPGADAIVTTALAGVTDPDRRVRTAMVRLLGAYPSPDATEGLLRALGDEKRRVRMAAVKACRGEHLADPRVVDALRRIVADEREVARIRFNAFFVLTSAGARSAEPDLAAEAVGSLADAGIYRRAILVRLCQAVDHTDETRALLRQFVSTGDKTEAVMATRALCDQVLLNPDLHPFRAHRHELRSAGEPAEDIVGAPLGAGTGNYWVPKPVLLALRSDTR